MLRCFIFRVGHTQLCSGITPERTQGIIGGVSWNQTWVGCWVDYIFPKSQPRLSRIIRLHT